MKLLFMPRRRFRSRELCHDEATIRKDITLPAGNREGAGGWNQYEHLVYPAAISVLMRCSI